MITLKSAVGLGLCLLGFNLLIMPSIWLMDRRVVVDAFIIVNAAYIASILCLIGIEMIGKGRREKEVK